MNKLYINHTQATYENPQPPQADPLVYFEASQSKASRFHVAPTASPYAPPFTLTPFRISNSRGRKPLRAYISQLQVCAYSPFVSGVVF